jgi:hypothetical protein
MNWRRRSCSRGCTGEISRLRLLLLHRADDLSGRPRV